MSGVTYRTGFSEDEPAGEHQCLLEHPLLGRVEEVVGPLHRLAQGLVTFWRTAGAGEETKAFVEPVPRGQTPTNGPDVIGGITGADIICALGGDEPVGGAP